VLLAASCGSADMVCAIGIVPMSRRRGVGIVCIAEARDAGSRQQFVAETAQKPLRNHVKLESVSVTAGREQVKSRPPLAKVRHDQVRTGTAPPGSVSASLRHIEKLIDAILKQTPGLSLTETV